MGENDATFQKLTVAEIERLKALAAAKTFRKDELIFSEGDTAERIKKRALIELLHIDAIILPSA